MLKCKSAGLFFCYRFIPYFYTTNQNAGSVQRCKVEIEQSKNQRGRVSEREREREPRYSNQENYILKNRQSARQTDRLKNRASLK